MFVTRIESVIGIACTPPTYSAALRTRRDVTAIAVGKTTNDLAPSAAPRAAIVERGLIRLRLGRIIPGNAARYLLFVVVFVNRGSRGAIRSTL
jgi:hypothetical protein